VPANGMAYDSFWVNGTGHTITIGAGQSNSITSDADFLQQRGSTSADAGSNDMSWTWSPEDNYTILVAIPLNAAAAVASPKRKVINFE
jgi:hypothetical protein